MIEMIDEKYYNQYREHNCVQTNEQMIDKNYTQMIDNNNDNNIHNSQCCERYPPQLGTPEEEDCSSAVLPDILGPRNSKRKVLVSDPVSMTKYLFDNHRLDMFSYLNKIRRNGTLSRIIGRRVLNGVFTREKVNFLDVTFWRIDRENFWADISVELKLQTDEGPIEWHGVIEVLCSFYEQFEFSIEGLSSERVSSKGLSSERMSSRELSSKALSPTVSRNGFDLSSSFLVPYFTNRRMDEIAEKMWEKYIPEALTNPKARSAVELAKRMGLQIEYHNIYDHNGVRGIIFFTDGELIVGDDRYEVDEEGNPHLVKTRVPKAVKIPANTIVVNTNKVKRNYSAFTVFHECIHYEFHYLFFRLQQMGNNDPRKMKSKEVIVDKDEEVKDEMVFIERQANRGAYGLMMPASHTRELINSGCGKVQEFRHQGDKYEKVGIELGKMLSLPDFHIRARMIQLGYIEAKGALNYAERKRIRAFAFDVDSWRERDHTYVIGQTTAYGIYNRNDDLKRLMDSGDYVYADGHIVRNEPRFVIREGDDYVLTDLANAHVDDCCLRFVRVYKQENIGQFIYGHMYCDTDYLKQTQFYLSDILNQKQMDDFEAKKKYKEEFPMDFGEAVKMLMKKNQLSMEKLAERMTMDRITLYRWLDEPKRYRNEDFLTILALIFKLPDWISDLLFKRAHLRLDEDDKRDFAIQHILRVQSEDGIDAANEYLKKNHLAPLSIDGNS